MGKHGLSCERSLPQLVLCMVFLDRKGHEEQLFTSSSQVAVVAGQPCHGTCAVSVAEGVQREGIAWAEQFWVLHSTREGGTPWSTGTAHLTWALGA